MSKLLEYLKAWAARIGYPTAEGSVTYNLPAFSEGETTAETTISAPGDGYIQICAWSITGAGVYNHSIKPLTENGISLVDHLCGLQKVDLRSMLGFRAPRGIRFGFRYIRTWITRRVVTSCSIHEQALNAVAKEVCYG